MIMDKSTEIKPKYTVRFREEVSNLFQEIPKFLDEKL
jgi:hypothetical protein